MSTWLKWVLIGALSVLFGVIALNHAVITSLAVTIFVGALLMISGGFQLVAGFTGPGGGGKATTIVLGLLLVLLGGAFVLDPFSGTISLAALVTVFIGLGGVLRLFLAWQMRATPFLWGMLLSGALSVLLAGYILANPGITLALLGILLGIELIFSGAGLIVLGFFLRSGRVR